ncbi:MAG: glycosyltransferase family 2 protein [Thiobacillus sp.]|nr:glycosyltransferase family 2 protein [Thiobacillus sp.]
MSTSPLVSVCVPTYNGAQYLRVCLDSILSQTLTDFEVLIVDDCSTDETLVIATEYAQRDKRIRFVKNERNLGLVGNWNRCVELAEGEWIKFVFQDDLIAPHCVESLMQAVQPGDAFVFCRRDFLFADNTPEPTRRYYRSKMELVANHFPRAGRYTAEQFCTVALTRVGDNFVGEPTAVMLHRELFERFGNFNPHLIVSCDVEYWTRVGIHVGCVHVPECLATFRVHAGGTSAVSRANRKYRMRVLDDLLMLHEAAYAPLYAPLRKVASRQQPPVSLARAFRKKARWAYGVAVQAARDPVQPDDSLIREWDHVAAHFARLRSIPWHYGFSCWRNKWAGQIVALLRCKREGRH